MLPLLNRSRAVLTALSLIMAAPAALAQTAPANILVVDTARIQEQSAASKSMQTQFREFETKLQAQVKAVEDKLKAEELGLKQQQTLLAPEQFDTKRREFETRVGEEQRKLQQSQQDMQGAVRAAQATLFKTLEPIVKEVMKERGANMIIDRRALLQVDDSLDVTAIVMERLNKKLPSIKLAAGGKK
ncbi:MAG TPA: OmpH family outer membrane protein [Alphaproteobacteria bacterium]|nr:OmpH family outer membrane protein [Alphaproteobacteria bacterium]